MKQQLKERIFQTVHNPVFQKPIENRDYSKTGTVKLITKIRRKWTT